MSPDANLYLRRDVKIISTIIHGDCLEVLPTLSADSIDLVMTDPPYVMPLKSSTSTKMSKTYKPRNLADFSLSEAYFKQWFIEIERVLKSTGKIIIFCDEALYPVLFRAGYEFYDFSALIWKKNTVGLGRNYRKSFEFILYGKSVDAPNFTEFRRDVLEFDTPRNKQHPTQEPIDLARHLIAAENAAVILDLFWGLAR